MSASPVVSSPPVICTGNRSGPSSRNTCRVPVIVQPKYIAFPSGESTPAPGVRTSSIAWILRLTSDETGAGANFARISGLTLPRPCPEYPVPAGVAEGVALGGGAGAAMGEDGGG